MTQYTLQIYHPVHSMTSNLFQSSAAEVRSLYIFFTSPVLHVMQFATESEVLLNCWTGDKSNNPNVFCTQHLFVTFERMLQLQLSCALLLSKSSSC